MDRWAAIEELGRGGSVPYGPGACICGHGKVWHRAKTRLRPCEVAGCDCASFAPDVPRGTPRPNPHVPRAADMGSTNRRPVIVRGRPGRPRIEAED